VDWPSRDPAVRAATDTTNEEAADNAVPGFSDPVCCCVDFSLGCVSNASYRGSPAGIQALSSFFLDLRHPATRAPWMCSRRVVIYIVTTGVYFNDAGSGTSKLAASIVAINRAAAAESAGSTEC